MILLYENTPEELYDMDPVNLKQRLYKVDRFESKGFRIYLTNHLIANGEVGHSVKDYSQIATNGSMWCEYLKILDNG